MSNLLLAVAILVHAAFPPDPKAADPMADLFAHLARLDQGSKPADFKPFLHPTKGLDLDVSSEGAPVANIVRVDSGSLDKSYDRAVKPLVVEGLFKSGQKCTREGPFFRCTLQTPASLPRTCTVEAHGSGWYLTRIEWVRDDPGADEEGDDDLPM